ncbi:MAG: hypothetical protein AAFP04_01440 [Myxococcota bacterium]
MRYVLAALCWVLISCSTSTSTSTSSTERASAGDGAAIGTGSDPGDGANDAIANAVGAALQGNAKRSVQLLEPIQPRSLNTKDRQFRSCMLQRFGDPLAGPEVSPESPGFAQRLTERYHEYWHASLTQPESREDTERQLDLHLRRLLGLPDSAQIDEIEAAVQRRLGAVGLHGLLGRTGVLRELMIWKQETRKAVQVEMPHGSYQTRVAFLDDFLVMGWGNYSTCGARGAGGWVAEGTLFAVVPRYESLDGEAFRVTFLGHETQHFLDLDSYPGIEPWELEYRAKLVELSLADATRHRVLRKFLEDQGDDPTSPHSYANRRLLRALVDNLSLPSINALMSVSGESMRAAARSLYDADTASRGARAN